MVRPSPRFPPRIYTHYMHFTAEGSFRRKTPRVQKPGSEDFNVYNNYNAYNATTYDSYGARY